MLSCEKVKRPSNFKISSCNYILPFLNIIKFIFKYGYKKAKRLNWVYLKKIRY